MADELGCDPAGTGAVGCSTRATLMGGQTTGAVALPRLSSARGLSKCWKSLRNLIALLLPPAFQTRNQEFQVLSIDLSSPRTHAREAQLGKLRQPACPISR